RPRRRLPLPTGAGRGLSGGRNGHRAGAYTLGHRTGTSGTAGREPVAPARRTWSVGLLVSLAIAASACGGSGGSGSGQGTASSSAPAATAEDINPTDRSRLQDGG